MNFLKSFSTIILIILIHKTNAQDLRLENYKLPIFQNEQFYGSKIPRTMSILENSTLENPQNLKIQFYGQSIIGRLDANIIVNKLKERYPTVKFDIVKNPIGGFTAPSLVKVAIHDLYHEYADLIIFHVYGGTNSGDLERIFINIKEKTTAEVIVFNHHLAYAGNNVTAQEKRDKSDYNGSKYIELLANKYNFEFVDIRSVWKKFININPEINVKSLLSDGVHPNKLGVELLAFCILKHFKYNPYIQFINLNRVYNIDPKTILLDRNTFIDLKGNYIIENNVELSKGSEITIEFIGNRIDLITTQENINSTIEILIDDEKPLNNPYSYYLTRPSSNFKMWWPAIKRIDLNTTILPTLEKYTLEIFNINRDKKEFDFIITGDKTGFDGKGNNKNDFISESKKISIQKSDFTIFQSEAISKKETPENYKIYFEVKALAFNNIYIKNSGNYIISKGLINKKHKLTIIILEGKLKIKEFKVFRPYTTMHNNVYKK